MSGNSVHPCTIGCKFGHTADLGCNIGQIPHKIGYIFDYIQTKRVLVIFWSYGPLIGHIFGRIRFVRFWSNNWSYTREVGHIIDRI